MIGEGSAHRSNACPGENRDEPREAPAEQAARREDAIRSAR
jgi:hypothetical protein